MNLFAPMDFAKSSAHEAWDQRNDPHYGNFLESKRAYRQNVVDTLREYNVSHHEAEALRIYDETIAKYEDCDYFVTYQRLDTPGKNLIATFQNLEDAQLWWDTILYLRNIYRMMSLRPQK